MCARVPCTCFVYVKLDWAGGLVGTKVASIRATVQCRVFLLSPLTHACLL